jgi:hypothetical protein
MRNSDISARKRTTKSSIISLLEGVEVKLHRWEPRNQKVRMIRYVPSHLMLNGKIMVFVSVSAFMHNKGKIALDN